MMFICVDAGLKLLPSVIDGLMMVWPNSDHTTCRYWVCMSDAPGPEDSPDFVVYWIYVGLLLLAGQKLGNMNSGVV